jgi:hypothetical protein
MKQIQIVLLVALFVTGCASPRLPDPHNHVINVHVTPWKTEDAQAARLVWVDPPPQDSITSVVTNQSRTARAYIHKKPWTGNSYREHIQIEDLKLHKVYELEGIPFEWRDYDELVWLEDRYLLFDRWTSPHYGRHFVVDFTKKKLMLMVPFPDEFYLQNNTNPKKKQPTH